jgi:hypothetical protein
VSRALAAAAVAAWALGAAAMPAVAWLWIRDGRRRLGLVAFAGAMVAQVSWLALVAGSGLAVLLDPRAGGVPGGWVGWVAGAGGLAALVSRLRPGTGTRRVRASDRAAEIGIGLFGLGVLLRQLALVA